MNPEQLLEEATTAIKHRTISSTHRWCLVYYYDRITCVPSCTYVPPEIIVAEFTDKMITDGFTALQWGTLKQNLVELYKELHK